MGFNPTARHVRVPAPTGDLREPHRQRIGRPIRRLPKMPYELVFRLCPRQDSNLRPSAPEADALSPELRGRYYIVVAPLGPDRLTHRGDRSGTATDSGRGHRSP